MRFLYLARYLFDLPSRDLDPFPEVPIEIRNEFPHLLRVHDDQFGFEIHPERPDTGPRRGKEDLGLTDKLRGAVLTRKDRRRSVVLINFICV